jgi:hypothetical protein
LPIDQPTRFEFVVNVRAARALGVTIPRLFCYALMRSLNDEKSQARSLKRKSN